MTNDRSIIRCFFGSLLVLISVDLMVEWLWQARVRYVRVDGSTSMFWFGLEFLVVLFSRYIKDGTPFG